MNNIKLSDVNKELLKLYKIKPNSIAKKVNGSVLI